METDQDDVVWRRIEADLTFKSDDGHAPRLIFSGYHCSSLHFDGYEQELGRNRWGVPYSWGGCYIRVMDREVIKWQETGRVRMEIHVNRRLYARLRVGDRFHLLEAGRRVAVGTVTAIFDAAATEE